MYETPGTVRFHPLYIEEVSGTKVAEKSRFLVFPVGNSHEPGVSYIPVEYASHPTIQWVDKSSVGMVAHLR